MSHEPTRTDLDQMNKRVKHLLDEGFPVSEAIGIAFEEMRGSPRMDDIGDGLKVTLLRAPDDEAHSSPGFQQEIRELDSAFKANGIEANARWLTQDSEDAWCGFVGVFVITAPIIVPAIRAVLVAYMKRRTGRKVLVELDGMKIKIEEPTTEEADRVLKLVEQKKKKKKKHLKK